jgi:RNA polymerase sigma factor (sigma-70 family)
MGDLPHTPDTRSSDPRSTASLAGGARGGNVEDLARLYEDSLPAMYVWIRGRVGKGLGVHVDAEDVLQEVWLRAIPRFECYDAQRSSFQTWLIGIAKNVLLESLRGASAARYARAGSEQVSNLGAVPDSVTTLTRAVARNEDVQRMLTVVETLDPDERLLLLGHGVEGLTLAQIGLQLGVSAETAGKRWQRLIARLREPAIWSRVLSPARG